MVIAVVTVSDRAAAGVYEDRSGPELERLLREAAPGADIRRELVPDERHRILEALERHVDADWIVTTGGTGPAPRDVTPEATAAFCDRELPGIAEAIRAKSLLETPNAVFSRGYSGLRGATYVVNLPGSTAAVRTGIEVLGPILEHGRKMARGEPH
ncbi:MAG: MogA/MoaB family molybdenum cofactor biosynthesis protein [Spirochaetales bacterium]|nr:MogA/MoaB family molybdenum cofactor biosynthesis protein [Spirochaetales bacterium]